jgi:hypothetical protein
MSLISEPLLPEVSLLQPEKQNCDNRISGS